MAVAKSAGTTTKKTAPKTTRTRTAAPKKGPKIIRNLRNMPVHLRLYSSLNPKDPFRVALEARGGRGDTSVIPINVQEAPQFVKGEGVLFEVITQTEYLKLEYEIPSFERRDIAKVVRDEDTVISKQDNWDGAKGTKQPERRSTGVNYYDAPGSDTGLHEKLRAAQDEAGSFDPNRRVPIERVRG